MQRKELPHVWEETTIESLFLVNPGHKGMVINDETEVSFIPMTKIEENTNRIDITDFRSYKDVKKGYTKFIENDLLFAKITPCMENGKIVIAKNLNNKIGCGTSEVYVFRSKGSCLTKYLYYYVSQRSFRSYCVNNFTGAVGHRRVPKLCLLYTSPSPRDS